MYLERKTYVKNWSEDQPGYKVTVTFKDKPSVIVSERVSHVVEEVIYWRKANAIHGWFVTNVQDGKDDCGTYYVSKDQLKQLQSICESVLADPEQAENILPTNSGFFFGSIEYDTWYMRDIERTINVLKECLEVQDNGDSAFYYHASW